MLRSMTMTLGMLLMLCSAAAVPDIAAPTCASVAGVVLGYNSNIGAATQAATQGACCALCQKNSRCKSWTYHDDKTCWLHPSIGPSRREAGTVSGVPSGKLPPIPPPAPPPHGDSGMGVPSGPDACTPGTNGTQFKFCDHTLSMDERLDDLIQRVEVEEIALELTARQSEPIDRIGVPSYYWGTNAIHGMQNVQCLPASLGGKCPTSFAAPVTLAATFNMSLVKDMGNVIGRELRAYYNAKVHNSLDTWSPTININRDPRWGRNVESPGEDPLVAGSYGSAYAQGLQQYTGVEKVVQSVVTLKHYFAYSIESYSQPGSSDPAQSGVNRQNVDVKISAYDLAHTFFPAWEQTVGSCPTCGHALGVMCSYNAVNGLPTCANPAMNHTLRGDWGFQGYMTSDSDSCSDLPAGHPKGEDHIPATPTNGTDATRQCLMGGTDIDSGGTYRGNLAKAVESGELDVKWARLGLKNSYKMRMMMGLFDPQVDNPYKHITTDVVGSDEHLAMALQSAKKGMTLLKKGPLPFAVGKSVAVIGQIANDTNSMTGNYDGPLCPKGGASCFPSLGEAIATANQGGTTTIVGGVDVEKGVAAAKAADNVVLVVDNFRDGGGEGHDRYTVGLSSDQLALANAVIAANKNTALVTVNGGLISLDDLAKTAPAILNAGMPGVQGGTAIAETIFGSNNPGGKLPVTMYHSRIINETDFLNMSMTNGVGRSYKYYTGTPLFPFGFGLSYTQFDVTWATPPPSTTTFTSKTDSATTYKVTVKNIGTVSGDEVVLAYTKPKAHTLRGSLGDTVPIEQKKLFGFQRVTVPAGGSAEISFELTPAHLAMVDEDGHTGLHNGEFEVVFSRGHGKELVAQTAVQLTDLSEEASRLKTFRKWW